MSETQESICQWANETFGRPNSNVSIFDRSQSEMTELRLALTESDANPKAPEEAADVIIVLMRLFEAFGTTWQAEVDKKMATNRQRKWTLTGNGHGQHVKEDK